MTASASGGSPLQVTFVMEQHLGHRTYYENLRASVDRDDTIAPRWVEVRYAEQDAWWECLPGLSERVRGTIRGRAEVRAGWERQRTDVSLFNTQVPAVIGGHGVRSRPYVLCTDITPRQYDRMAAGYGHAVDRGRALARYKHRVNTAVFSGAAAVIAWSSWVRESLVEDYGVDPGRITVIPPGVDVVRWRPERRREDGPMRILFVGGDFHRKGGDTVLEAFRDLPRGLAELVLVTHTPVAVPEGVTVAAGLSPNSAELLTLYRSCDVFALPSGAEAFGIAAVEAAAAGMPAVTTRVGGLADIVVDGETGYLVDPGDAGALADRLRTLAGDADARRRLGEAGRRRVVQHFDARANARRVIDVLHAAAGSVGSIGVGQQGDHAS